VPPWLRVEGNQDFFNDPQLMIPFAGRSKTAIMNVCELGTSRWPLKHLTLNQQDRHCVDGRALLFEVYAICQAINVAWHGRSAVADEVRAF
jgi:hypothetical protein